MENLFKDYQIELKKQEKKFYGIMIIFFILSFFFIYSLYENIKGNHNTIYFYILLSYIILSFYSSTISSKKNKLEEKINILQLYKKHKDHQFDDLEDGMSIDHPIYLEDLHILGKHSFFQYMNIAKTKQGKEKLIQRFTNTEEDQTAYKEAIMELSSQKEVLIDLQSSIIIENLGTLKDCFQTSKHQYKAILLIDLLLDLITLTSFFVCKIELALLIFLFHICIASFYLKLIPEYALFQKSMITIGQMQIDFKAYNSELLKKIKKDLNFEVGMKKKIKLIDSLIHLDQNAISSMIFNGLCSLRLVILMIYAHSNIEKYLDDCIEAYSLLEVIGSFSYLTLLEKMNPVMISDHFAGVQIKNPLIENCVGNQFDAKMKMNIITGSNMSGKTSFLRAVGINCIFANACGFSFCESLSTPIYHIYTSMNVKDDPSKGISTFYGELLRVKEAMDGEFQKLVLIDEIFKGTNYNDRIIGAKSIIHKLQEQNALVMITTHDFQLCDEKDVDNYYFIEQYENEQIQFDYLIHSGKNEASNALYLMKKLGMV